MSSPYRSSGGFGNIAHVEGALQGSVLARFALYAFVAFKIYNADPSWSGRIPTLIAVAGTCMAYEAGIRVLRYVDARRVETRAEGQRFRNRWTFLSSLVFLLGLGAGGYFLSQPLMIVAGVFLAAIGFLAARVGLDTLFSNKHYSDDLPVG